MDLKQIKSVFGICLSINSTHYAASRHMLIMVVFAGSLLLPLMPYRIAAAQTENSSLSQDTDNLRLAQSVDEPKLPPSFAKLEKDIEDRAKIVEAARKLKAEKPDPNKINDSRILSPRGPERYAMWYPEYKKLSPKCQFAFWYVQMSVEFYYAYYQHTPENLEEFVSKDYLPFPLNQTEISSITNVLKLYGWNLSDRSIAFRELRFEKMRTHPKYTKDEFEARLPYFMFNSALTFALDNYISIGKTRFYPTFTDFYRYFKEEFGVNEKFWSYMADTTTGTPKGQVFFIKEGSKDRVPENYKLTKGDMLLMYYAYEKDDCDCNNTPNEFVGKVRNLSFCITY